jgi:cell division septation protein DedD
VKERLTGAIILVVLIVLLVPELLSGPSRSVPAPQAAATSSEEPPLRSYTINLADDSHSADSSAGTSNASPQANGPEQPTPITESPTSALQGDSEASTEGSPIAPQASPTAATQTQAPPPSSTSPPEQPRPMAPHGSAAPPGQQRLSAEEKVAAGQRSAAAERLTAHLTAERLNAERAAAAQRPPATDRAESGEKASSSAGSGWMVQLGVFSIKANAERLAQELKGQGFHALVSENGGGGRPLWRVRTAPVAERAAAEQLNARLRAAGHAGSVVPK